MRAMSKLWHDCTNYVITRNEWEYVRKIVIDGVVYTDDQIQSASQSRGMIDGTFSIGNTVSAEFEATLIPNDNPQEIKIRDKVEFYVKIKTISNGDTEWFPFGTFYVEDAEMDGDYFKIKCYDKLAYLDDDFPLTSPTLSEALSEILYDSGLQLYGGMSSLSRLNLTLTKADKFTYREVLGYIGSLNCGNWYITEDNKLKLIKPGITGSPVIRVGKDNTKILKRKPTMLFDKFVVKRSENKGDKFVVGSGKRKFEVFNPWGDSTLASDVANQLNGYSIYPGDISSTEINPAVEIGDAAEVNGRLVQLSLVNYNTRMFLSFVSPTATEKFPQNLTIRDLEDRVSKLEEKVDNGGNEGPVDDSCKVVKIEHLAGTNNFVIYSPILTVPPDTKDYYRNSNGYCAIIKKDLVDYIKAQPGDPRPLSISLGDNTSETIDKKLIMKEPFDLWFSFTPSRANTDFIVDLSNFETSGVTNMKHTFSGCNYIEGFDLLEIKTNSVTNMDFMFAGVKLDVINLSSFNTRKVKTMEGMFSGVITSKLDLSSFNTYSLENAKAMFKACVIKRPLSIDFSTKKVKTFREMFMNAHIEELDIRSFKFDSIWKYKYEDSIDIDGTLYRMFYGLSSKKLILPEANIQINKNHDIREMFYGCDVETIDASKLTISKSEEFIEDGRAPELFSGSESKVIKTPIFENGDYDTEIVRYEEFNSEGEVTFARDEELLFYRSKVDTGMMFKDCYNLETIEQTSSLSPNCSKLLENTPNLRGTIDLSAETFTNGSIGKNTGIDYIVARDYRSKKRMIDYGFNLREDGTRIPISVKYI